MSQTTDFYRIQKLPPYVFAVINEMKAKARAAKMDVVDLGMGNPDGPTPDIVVDKLVEASRNSRNHRYSLSKGIPHLRQEIVKRYAKNYNVTLNPDTEAIVTTSMTPPTAARRYRRRRPRVSHAAASSMTGQTK